MSYQHRKQEELAWCCIRVYDTGLYIKFYFDSIEDFRTVLVLTLANQAGPSVLTTITPILAIQALNSGIFISMNTRRF